jgi:hypothetical protein
MTDPRATSLAPGSQNYHGSIPGININHQKDFAQLKMIDLHQTDSVSPVRRKL